MKSTSFRFRPEVLAQLHRLAQPGESQISVIQRALNALEGQPAPLSIEALALRIDAVENRLGALESGNAPALQPVAQTAQTTAPDTEKSNKLDSGPGVFTIENTAPDTGPAPKPKAAPSERGYSADVKALAIQMRDAGKGQSDICDEIERIAGKRPNPKNINRQIEQWRAAV